MFWSYAELKVKHYDFVLILFYSNFNNPLDENETYNQNKSPHIAARALSLLLFQSVKISDYFTSSNSASVTVSACEAPPWLVGSCAALAPPSACAL